MAEIVPLTALQRAMTWLRAVLASGPLPVRAVEELAREAGVARRTLRRARAKLGVRSWPMGFGEPHALGLPEHANGESPDPAHRGPLEAVTTADAEPRREAPRAGRDRWEPSGVRRVVLRRIR